MKPLGEVSDATFHHTDLALELILVALQAVALNVDDAPQPPDETDESFELPTGALDVIARRTDPVAKLSDALLEATNPLCEQIAGFGTWGHQSVAVSIGAGLEALVLL